jgi:uncharacterized protein
MSDGIFLRAQWEQLAMFNFDTEPSLLRPLLPRCVELDLFRDRALITLVAFQFKRARLFGCRVPLHQSFCELNLRCYVRRDLGDHMRPGVVFLKEIVPKRAVVWVANRFGEHFAFAPMSHACTADQVHYKINAGSSINRVSLCATGDLGPPTPGSEQHFVLQREYAYNVSARGQTCEYQVEHPPWHIRRAQGYEIDLDAEQLYGPRLGAALRQPPSAAFLVDGSEACVHRGALIAPALPVPPNPRRFPCPRLQPRHR